MPRITLLLGAAVLTVAFVTLDVVLELAAPTLPAEAVLAVSLAVVALLVVVVIGATIYYLRASRGMGGRYDAR